MQDIWNINKSEYTSLLANRSIPVKNNPSLGALLRKIKYLTKRDLIHLAKLRDLLVNETDLVNIIQILLKSVLGPKVKDELYRELEKRKYNKIITKVKRLKRFKKLASCQKRKYIRKRPIRTYYFSKLTYTITKEISSVTWC